jgi:hypothetical protein
LPLATLPLPIARVGIGSISSAITTLWLIHTRQISLH